MYPEGPARRDSTFSATQPCGLSSFSYLPALALSSAIMRDFEFERLQTVLGKRNREFESNLFRQSVLLFLSLGDVPLEKAILPPKTREYRTDKHRHVCLNARAGVLIGSPHGRRHWGALNYPG